MPTFRLERILALTGLLSAANLPAVDFNREVRPILSDKCFACHGPDARKVKGDLRLDQRDNAVRVNENGRAAIVPGDPSKSELVARLVTTDPDEVMPPPESHKDLSAEEIGTLRRWIAEGAHYERHWAYRELDWPTAPPAEGVKVRNAIDRFIQIRLAAEGLKPAPEADRVTLIRRLSFDLLGLPPSPGQVKQFVADPSDQAWERLIDDLLKSPHYGERMAAYWLDLVRYADTRGYHGDQHQDITPFRDYVIDAFNRNYPFDRFTAEQLAGDLLPEPSMEQKIASGYNKLLMTTTEGGAQPKEYTAKYAADRVRNASSVWLGATLGCAECHDHKYDPFTQKDFYSFAAFFADVRETPVGGLTSIIKLPTEAETKKLADLDARIVPLEKEIRDTLASIQYKEPSAERLKQHVARQSQPPAGKSEGTDEIILVDDAHPDCRKVRANKDNHPFQWDTEVRFSGSRSWRRSDPQLAQDVFDHFKEPVSLRAGDTFFVHVRPDPEQPPKAVMLQFRTDNWNHRANWGDLAAITYGGTNVNANKSDLGPLPKPGEWTRLEVPVAKIGLKPGQKITSIACTLSGGAVHWDQLGLIRRPEASSGDKWQPKDSLELESEISLAAWEKWIKREKYKDIDRGLKNLLTKARDKRTEAEQDKVLKHYLENVWQPRRAFFADLQKRLKPLKKDRDATDQGILRTMVTETIDQPRMLRVLPRGNWLDESGEERPPAVPASLGTIRVEGRRANRLDLARWLTSRDNPLVARVFVNRLWKILFGRGITTSLDDFGMQGTNPSHPELLDWLAMEFIASGWDVKHTIKLIALSHTYRQSSVTDDRLRARDPYNDLFARQGRFRLEAEMVRDNALAVSGLLVDTMGGRSVKPYQPEGYWIHLNFPKRTYEHDEGEKQYRRGLYTYWCRTFLHPSLAAFDASTREECVVERVRSNTPQQALVLLNDPTYVEAARSFAELLLQNDLKDDNERLQSALRRALSRTARAGELELLRDILNRHRKQYDDDEDAAKQLLENGLRPPASDLPPAELAAWTSVTRVLFNLHEFITRQ